MARSHPPSLLRLVERALAGPCRPAPGATWLVAVSGGPDSQALLHALGRVAPRRGLSLVAHGVDHGLRAEAGSELGLAAELAASLGIPFSASALRVRAGPNLQARARTARFAALREAAQAVGAAHIALGHHADDRAETLLLRLLRGSGPRGLGVMRWQEGDRVRPLLAARRADIEAHLERHGVRFARDPSNLDPRFLRVRVRTEVLPLLVQLSPRIVDHLNALAEELSAGPAAEPPATLEVGGTSLALSGATRRALGAVGDRALRLWLPGGHELEVPARRRAPRRPAGAAP